MDALEQHAVSGGAYGSSPFLSSPQMEGRRGSRVAWQNWMRLGVREWERGQFGVVWGCVGAGDSLELRAETG